ncbi:XrtA/PEP-CTERM system TPR-repeat protein PrsT [Paraglaciecola sp.]|uniref:XrtA/PEP-CTERM system TPR-repeat protein PrsT n=1 Tax=Paraglaciecola sp. TaxID=1920173 RepID=UPI00273DB23C|nr:XrtA/PEP-CTERM system TPR-repeat protein PrsT [Paraglaciecola sp.]MDP5031972.1 PEP-CTERM system TPR-repeat protein PrsT [Paraglaciecola sp.]
MNTHLSLPKMLKFSLISLSVSLLLGCGPKTAEEHIAEAQQFISENNNTAAIVALKNAVQADPKSSEARFALGKVYLDSKQYESAEKELNRAFEYGYEPSKVLPLLTKAYEKTGAYAALSKVDEQQAGLTSVERAEIGYFKVLSLVKLGKEDDARLLIEDLASLDTSSVYKGLTAAYVHIMDKDFDTALEALQALKTQSPLDPEILKLLAQVELALNKPQEAADVFKEYVGLYPDDLQIKFVLAKLLVDLGRMDEAESYVDSLLAVNDQNALLNQLKSAIKASQQDFATALKFAETGILNGSVDPSLRLIAGYSAYKIADYASANRHLSFIVSSLPDNHPALRMLAASQLQIGLTNEAGEVLERIDDLSKEDAPLLSKASYQLIREGYEKDARGLVEKSIELSDTAEDFTRLGLLQLSLNNLDGIVNLEEAVEKSPELVSAQTTLATAYVATGQYDKALELAAKWKASSPKEIKPYLIKGQIHIKRQEYTLAQKEYEEAAAIDSKAFEAPMALINLDLVQNRLEAATEKLGALLKRAPDYLPALAANYLFLSKNGQSEQGLQKIKELVAKKPQDIDARLLLARVYVAEQKYDDSLKVLNGFTDTSKLPKTYWTLKGQSLIANNMRSEAEKHYDAWLKIYPNDKEATIGRLLLLDSENKFTEGAEMARSFLQKRDDVQMQILLTHFLLMSSDIKAGKDAYEKLPAATLAMPIAKGFLARLQLEDKKPEDALPNALAAYQANPSYRNVVMVTFIYEQLKQADKGLQFLQQHIDNRPSDMASRMLLAERQIGDDTESAMRSYELAIQANPKNYVAFNNLAYLNLQQGKLQKAKEYAVKAVELMPANPATLDTLAQVLVAEKNYEEALKYYERAVSDKNVSEEIYLNYVDALFLAKQDVLAKRKLGQREFKEEISLKRVGELKAKY